MSEYVMWNNHLIWDADGSYAATPNRVLSAETDINGRKHVIEDLGDRMQNLYRGTKAENRAYTIVVKMKAGGLYTITDLIAEWEAWHSKGLGQCLVERMTENGVLVQLLAVAETPQWSDQGPTWATVTQTYTAAFPFWYPASEQSATANFDGATPVSLPFNNLGSVPTWARLLIEGPVETPKIAYGTEWEQEYNLTVEAGGTLAITCKTPASAWYYPPVGADVKAYNYRTNESSYRKAKLPAGSGNLTLTAASGTGPCTIYWTDLYEALP